MDARWKAPLNARKITACVACRKLKIKCLMTSGGKPPCARCSKRGDRCTVSDLPQGTDDDKLQQLMQRVMEFEEFMRDTRLQISSVQSQLRLRDQMSPSHKQDNQNSVTDTATDDVLPTDNVEEDNEDDHQQHGEITIDVDSGLATIPSQAASSNAKEMDGTRETLRRTEDELLHQGILNEEQAQTLFNVYANRLDYYLYRILRKDATLAKVRQSSGLLLAAIYTVATLHCAELAALFGPCYRHFRNTVSDVVLRKDTSLDDIRGLCIGAFWLRDMSWTLSSTAVSLAMQHNLHHIPADGNTKGSAALHERIRLYYLVYICDHHFSIYYGRPPLTTELALMRSAQLFFDDPESTEDDVRLVAQSQLWVVATHIVQILGFNTDTPLVAEQIPAIHRLIVAIDTWRADWYDGLSRSAYVGNYPRKGVKLHCHFAKLYLCSHAYRGMDMEGRTGDAFSSESQASSGSRAKECDVSEFQQDVEEIAEVAIKSAQSILQIIISDSEIQEHLNGLPLYFDTMIAFAIVFLYKISTRYSTHVKYREPGLLQLIESMSETLQITTKDMHPRHFLSALARAVQNLLQTQKNQPRDVQQVQNQSGGPFSAAGGMGLLNTPITQDASQLAEDAEFDLECSSDIFDWSSYDFLALGHDFMGTLDAHGM